MFQTALEHINLNSNNCIQIQQFKSIFRGKMTKGIPALELATTERQRDLQADILIHGFPLPK